MSSSFRNVYVMLIAGLALSACTSNGPRPVTIENPSQPPQTAGQNGGGDGGKSADGGPALGGDKAGQAGVTLSKQALSQYAIDLNNLRYKFTYLTETREDKIVFDAAGKAQLKFANLASDQSGTVTLDVLEGTTLKLRGTAEGVTLKKGENTTIPLTLKEVDPNGGGNGGGGNDTTDLTIDVTLDDASNPPPSNGGGNGGGGQNGGGNGGGQNGGGNGNGGGNVDPIATWDGKSNLGNSKWTIVPVGTP